MKHAVIAALMLMSGLYADSVSGYLENAGSLFLSDSSGSVYSKMQLEFEKQTGPLSICAKIDYIAYSGRREFNLLDFTADSFSAGMTEDEKTVFEDAYQNEGFVNDAYITLHLAHADITAGRQQIGFGSGYAWNPTDIVNHKSVIDPDAEKRGADALRVDFVTRSSVLNLVLLPEDIMKESAKIFRILRHYPRFDAALIAQQHLYTELNESGETQYIRNLYGYSITGQAGMTGVWSEGAVSFENSRKHEILTGIDYTWDNGLYVMAEYMHSQYGMKHDYMLSTWMNYFSGTIRSVARSNVFLYLRYPYSDTIDISSSLIAAPDDRSMALVPEVAWSVSDNTELTLSLAVYTGAENSAYSKKLGEFVGLKIKSYF